MTQRLSPIPDDSAQQAEPEESRDQRLLTALSDPMCRKILEATSDQSMTATDLSETLTLPLSTIYRKLKILADTPVIEESNQVSNEGHHATEYEAIVGRIQITLSESDDSVLTVDRFTDSE